MGLYDAVADDYPNFDFFTRHNQLQSVDCVLYFNSIVPVSNAASYAVTLISCLFDSCPNLQKLKLFQYEEEYLSGIQYISLDAKTSGKLVKSGLKSLSLNFNMQIELPSDAELTNKTLKSLEFYSPAKNDMFVVLCRIFRGLTHLMITYMDDESLQNIWKYQVGVLLIVYVGKAHFYFSFSPILRAEIDLNIVKGHSDKLL